MRVAAEWKNSLEMQTLDRVARLRELAASRAQKKTPNALEEAIFISEGADKIVWELAQCTSWLDYRALKKHASELEAKALQSTNDGLGGYAMPAPILQPLMQKPLSDLDDIRSIAREITITEGDSLLLPTTPTRAASVWRRETDLHPPTADAQFNGEAIPTHPIVCTMSIHPKLIEQDGGQWATEHAADSMRVAEGQALVGGTGVGQPEGVNTNRSVATVKSGNASALTANGVIALHEALPQFYRRNATWICNGNTLSALRQLATSTGDPILKDSWVGGPHELILGRPVIACPSMPDIASGSYPLLIGDFSYYWIVTRIALSLLVDPYSAKPNVVFDFTRRVGGQIVLPDAFRKQIIST